MRLRISAEALNSWWMLGVSTCIMDCIKLIFIALTAHIFIMFDELPSHYAFLLPFSCISCLPRIIETTAPPISAHCASHSPRPWLSDNLTHDHTYLRDIIRIASNWLGTEAIDTDRHRLAVETHGSYNLVSANTCIHIQLLVSSPHVRPFWVAVDRWHASFAGEYCTSTLQIPSLSFLFCQKGHSFQVHKSQQPRYVSVG